MLAASLPAVQLLSLSRLLRHRRRGGSVVLKRRGSALVIGVDGHGVAGLDSAELATVRTAEVGSRAGSGGSGGGALVGAGNEAEVGKRRDRVAGGEDGFFFVVDGLVEGREGGGCVGGLGMAEEEGVAGVEGGEGVAGLEFFCCC